MDIKEAWKLTVIFIYIGLSLSVLGVVWGIVASTKLGTKVRTSLKVTKKYYIYILLQIIFYLSIIILLGVSFYYFSVWFVMNPEAKIKYFPWDTTIL